MRINIQDLREGPFVYEVALEPEFLGEDQEAGPRFETATGKVTFRILQTEILATGKLETVVHSECGRCLGPVRRKIKADVHLYYWPKDTKHEESLIEEIDPDEPDYGVYEGDSLDPDPDLRELLLVEIPSVLICRKDCKGLCPRCGHDLNQGPCDHPPETDDDIPVPEEADAWKSQLKSIQSNLKKS
jgi:uncharacterized metal-binding protein YceD (DUF177 family)